MIDYAKITVIAGSGGRGAGSFTHIKGKRRGKADGGDGGRGGNIYLLATRDLNTLEPFRYVKEYRAKGGVAGASRRRRGADGQDLVIKVPVGTLVRPETTDYGLQTTDESASVATVDGRQWTVDLTQEGQETLVARGGEGGRGNAKLRDEFGRRPLAGEPGEPGEVRELVLELKLIADVGLIGLPNAGKSTLLSALTSAKPQIASYPFTTLEPNLGVLSASSIQRLASRKIKSLNANSLNAKRSLVLADIPGLIEGASKGRGLGDLFLRHIERTKILVHLIDASGATGKWQDYQVVRGELKEYSRDPSIRLRAGLAKKREIVVLTKIDLVDDEKVGRFLKFFKSKKKKVLAISAKTGEGLGGLAQTIYKVQDF